MPKDSYSADSPEVWPPDTPLLVWAGRLLAAPVRAAVFVDRLLARPSAPPEPVPARITFVRATSPKRRPL